MAYSRKMLSLFPLLDRIKNVPAGGTVQLPVLIDADPECHTPGKK